MASTSSSRRKTRSSATTRRAGRDQPRARSRAEARSKRRLPGAGGVPVEQRHLDLIGLAMVAAGVFAGFVLYLGWDGGSAGSGLRSGLELAVGQAAYLAPVALFAGGVALISRPVATVRRGLYVGIGLVSGAILLALAAGILGLGSDSPPRDGYFVADHFRGHGGVAGEVLYWSSASIAQRIGAEILAILMFASGLLLVTGTTVAAIADRAHSATRSAARSVREATTPPEGWVEPDPGEIAITRAIGTGDELETTTVSPDLFDFEPGVWPDDDPDGDEGAGETDPTEPGTTAGFAYEDLIGSEDDSPGAGEPAGAEPELDDVPLTPMGNRREAITTSDELDFILPQPKILDRTKGDQGLDPREREATAKALLEALRHFGVEARLVGMVSGPHVSRYELQLAPGTKVGKVAQLKDDLAYALASTDIRILAPIPGKKAVGVEVPNQRRRMVRLGDIYEGRPKGASPLAVWLGKDVSGQACWADLALMPHLLVAGTTGSGKSGCINAMLSSILMHASPNEVRLVLVDPKRVELNHYEDLPHLLTPVVTNPRLAANVLSNLIVEMESRYKVMGEARCRNLGELNRVRHREAQAPLPHILCVIDELADLMMVAPAEVEESIIRLAQKSRAVGIHLVLATQRPSTDVITGTIKVNIPARIAFAVASQVDSRVILDGGGAESLLGQGDMLFRPIGTSKLQRIQGAFLTEDEIARITRVWVKQGDPQFDPELLQEPADASSGRPEAEGELSPDQDDLLEQAARIVVESGTASVSMIQRRLRVGYTRAGRLIDMLERRGIISGYEGSKPRQVLCSMADLSRLLGAAAQGSKRQPASGQTTETELERIES